MKVTFIQNTIKRRFSPFLYNCVSYCDWKTDDDVLLMTQNIFGICTPENGQLKKEKGVISLLKGYRAPSFPALFPFSSIQSISETDNYAEFSIFLFCGQNEHSFSFSLWEETDQ